ncbi:hypothetical protein N0V95_001903 [Ascochyta clinopodiicola]|nr:hypothetical protein N0V95_001903 [Ascochyta clinopodiicola]
MAPLENFVKNRNGQAGTSPNGLGPVNPSRQAAAANARVQVVRPGVSRTPVAQHGLPLRGESVNQQQSLSLPQHLQRRPLGEGRKRDNYDTDTESLNSTANQSVIQVENSPHGDQKQLQPENEGAETDDEGEASSEYEYDGEEEEEEEAEYHFDQEAKDYLERNGKGNASYGEQLHFMQRTQPQLFPTVDGDSYPTTTDGNLTELVESAEAHIEDLGSPSPSPQRGLQHAQSAVLSNQQPLQQGRFPSPLHANLAGLHESKIYQKGEQIRGQQRTDGARGQQGQQHDAIHPPTSQLPSYSQANREQGFPAATHARREVTIQAGQAGFFQEAPNLPSAPELFRNPLPKMTEPTAFSKHISTTRANAIPTIQQYTEPTPVEEPLGSPDVDYKSEVLFELDYEHLAHESFDKDPRASEPFLSEDMLEKSLVERLQFVHRKLDPAAQAKFFGALPTNEWEDAGDWFLDQFSELIKKTKDARQKKRKAAQEFEQEIEKRHTHVAKKQKLVEGAMIKMKTQGEGLVPKSPRASKSPRPRRA